MPADATDEQIEARNAEITATAQLPGRFLPYLKGRDASGRKIEKERFVQDFELTPEELGRVRKIAPREDEKKAFDLGNRRVPAVPRLDDLRPGNSGATAQASFSGAGGDTQGNLALKPEAKERYPVIPFPKPRLVPPAQASFDKKAWKLSREKPGCLIRRIKGYDITEDKYGISYLYRLPGGATTTQQGEHAGYYNWLALEAAGRLKKVGEE
ncbi:MAG TPA: hypothetical protein PLD20_24455 [Blastocatellia bacterium]|nr:hypothetical protein [Blastocatellia bacterium]HMY73432.1 hypothetical protein [Blastocatellia bacterium]HMZ21108.1 hypothetical protein [Blastocatellia bacterium]HNG34080.1 hypothetical protein [Blastocatellia bacterium]